MMMYPSFMYINYFAVKNPIFLISIAGQMFTREVSELCALCGAEYSFENHHTHTFEKFGLFYQMEFAGPKLISKLLAISSIVIRLCSIPIPSNVDVLLYLSTSHKKVLPVRNTLSIRRSCFVINKCHHTVLALDDFLMFNTFQKKSESLPSFSP
uniref:Uncharacterized protein n=1 Tax=Rhipicephalus zambeziensis TaxID=60191 RepID=A0A224Y5U1_9ACAR